MSRRSKVTFDGETGRVRDGAGSSTGGATSGVARWTRASRLGDTGRVRQSSGSRLLMSRVASCCGACEDRGGTGHIDWRLCAISFALSAKPISSSCAVLVRRRSFCLHK